MITTNLVLASAWLLIQQTTGHTLNIKSRASQAVYIPKTTSTFSKDNIPVQWVSGHPKELGMEDLSYTFNTPEPDDVFDAYITDDEKHLGMFNGTHIRIINLDSDMTACTFSFDRQQWTGNTYWPSECQPEPISQSPATSSKLLLARDDEDTTSPDGQWYVETHVGGVEKPTATFRIHSTTDPDAAPIEVLTNDWQPGGWAWGPRENQVTVCDRARLRIFDVPSMTVVQTWEAETFAWTSAISDVGFLDDDNRKLTWSWQHARFLYGFEANVMWVFALRLSDRIWGPTRFVYLKTRGYVMTVDGDSVARFWKL